MTTMRGHSGGSCRRTPRWRGYSPHPRSRVGQRPSQARDAQTLRARRHLSALVERGQALNKERLGVCQVGQDGPHDQRHIRHAGEAHTRVQAAVAERACIVHRYAVAGSPRAEGEDAARVCVIAGKAAPGKAPRRSSSSLAREQGCEQRREVRGIPQVVFIPNFNVSLAELIIPASDVSQHIHRHGGAGTGT